MSKFIVVIGCPESRIKDLTYIFDLALKDFGLSGIFINNDTYDERELGCEIRIKLDLNDYSECLSVVDVLSGYELKAILYFSDVAMDKAPIISHLLGHNGPDLILSKNSFDKYKFRLNEEKNKHLAPSNSYIPKHSLVNNITEINNFLEKGVSKFILKPRSEAASRGVSRVEDKNNIIAAFTHARIYDQGDLLIEELLEIGKEFSFDGVKDQFFITQKMVINGQYPVEIGQIVPAPITSNLMYSLASHGKWMNTLVCRKPLAFHNELALIETSTEKEIKIASIESNQRPAGMSIWTLANIAFDNDFYKNWIACSIDYSVKLQNIKARCYAITVMHSLPQGKVIDISINGGQIKNKFVKNVINNIDNINYHYFEWFDNKILIGKDPKSNSDFCAQSIFYTDNLDVNPEEKLLEIRRAWEDLIKGY